jgi:hypothetical protein
MKDNINQKNVFGDNMFKSKKTILTKHRVQGFIAGVLASLIATIIYELLIKPNL